MLIFYIVVLLFFITFHANALPSRPPVRSECDHSFNYTKDSKFESNLNTVFNNLIEHTDETRFNISVDGQSPDRIYGLLQCIGDATADQCYICSENATTALRQNCGNAVGGKFWFDTCYLRYANYSFIGEMDTSELYDYNVNNVSNPDIFNAALQSLLANLSAEAANEPERKRYASGTTAVSFFPKIYALVQCTRDISNDNCTACLSTAMNYIFEHYPRSKGARGLLGNCIVRYETYSFFNSIVEAPAPVANTRPAQSTPSKNSTHIIQSETSSNKIPLILGVAGGLFLMLMVICVIACGRRLKYAIFQRLHEVNEQAEEYTVMNEDRQIVFTMETLLAATENFHDDNKLGEGGFGPVYKGTLSDGKEIAVKKLCLKSRQGKKEFLNEVKLVTKIQHRNLVNLLGCCTEGLEKLLVYEYLPNKSLDKILFDPEKRNQLDWQKRYNIIVGIARGLLYLHQDSRLRIIHRDIKASNILLDEKLDPKVADFGLARLFPEDESHVSTRVAGTYGYMAPEYAMQGQLSVKADVYSFGVLLLEVVTGRKNTDYNLSPEMQMLLEWAWRSYEHGNIEQMIDRAIIETCDEEQALRCIVVGLLCTQADSSLRPPMSTITLMISSHSVTLPDPTKPAFVSSVTQTTSSGSGLSHASVTAHSSVSSASSHILSNADASITELVPR